MSSRMTAWRRAFIEVVTNCAIARSCVTRITSISVDRTGGLCINILFDAYRCAIAGSPSPRRRRPRAPARVAIAGATGYTGQELLRSCRAIPAVTLTAAMSSGTTAARKLPALARLWNGDITPLSPDTLRDADVVFLALPDAAAAELAPALVDAGVRVIDLSGAFRLTDAGRARALVSGDAPRAGRARSTASPSSSARRRRRRAARRESRLLSDGHAAGAGAARRAPASSRPAPTSSSTRSRACRAPARRRPSGRISPRSTAACGAYGVFGHRHGAEIEQGVASATGGPHRHLRAAPGAARSRHSVDHLRAPGAGHDRRRARRRVYQQAYAGGAVRPARRHRRCRRSSTSRTRTSATSAGASMPRAAPSSCRSSTTCSRARRARPCRTST